MSIGTTQAPALLIEFTGGRQATFLHIQNSPFLLTLQFESGHSARIAAEADFFAAFIDNLVQFFHTGISTVEPEETIMVITLIEYGLKAMQTPYQWIELPGTFSE